MAINYDKIPRSVLIDLVVDGEIPIEVIKAASPREVFAMWLNWHGIINWSEKIWQVCKELQEQE